MIHSQCNVPTQTTVTYCIYFLVITTTSHCIYFLVITTRSQCALFCFLSNPIHFLHSNHTVIWAITVILFSKISPTSFDQNNNSHVFMAIIPKIHIERHDVSIFCIENAVMLFLFESFASASHQINSENSLWQTYNSAGFSRKNIPFSWLRKSQTPTSLNMLFFQTVIH